MTTVVARTFRSSPHRDALTTWKAIVTLLAKRDAMRTQLEEASSIAASLIADRAPLTAPIVVTCDGPRTRIYCVYDDDALDPSEANEANLPFDPLEGNWAVSLPCPAEDLAWVQKALGELGTRITARDLASGAAVSGDSKGMAGALTIDLEGLLKP